MASGTLIADIATFDLVGISADIFEGQITFILEGVNVDTRTGQTTFKLTGLDIETRTGRTTFILTGLDVEFIINVVEGRTLTAEPGSFVLTGIDACFEIAGGVNNFPRPKQRRPHLGELIEEEEIEILILIQAFLHQQHHKHVFS